VETLNINQNRERRFMETTFISDYYKFISDRNNGVFSRWTEFAHLIQNFPAFGRKYRQPSRTIALLWCTPWFHMNNLSLFAYSNSIVPAIFGILCNHVMPSIKYPASEFSWAAQDLSNLFFMAQHLATEMQLLAPAIDSENQIQHKKSVLM